MLHEQDEELFQSRTGGVQVTYLRKVEHLFRSQREQVTPQSNGRSPFRFPREQVISHSTWPHTKTRASNLPFARLVFSQDFRPRTLTKTNLLLQSINKFTTSTKRRF